MDASIFQFKTVDKKLSGGTLRNLADLAWIHDERGAFAAAANTIREQEKTRVARELHDELAQPLTALKMDTIWVRDNLVLAPEAAAARLGEMVEMLDRTVAATRRIASDLRPLLLDDLGLVPAVEWLVSKFTQRCGVVCTLAVDDALELQEPYATAVFRIIQESLANVAKHAGASEVAVTIERQRGAVTLSVHDNGCGFSPAAPRKPQSLGIMGLRERAQLLKGKIIIESAPGQGTCVQVSIPLPQVGLTQ
ncbi:MAG: sensor histidine kinase [Polaromonas sp.]|jgi:signal transduction histidine kinase|uniref:sensor histidine kinase n=1 Tax=Polaromonas sp. TaxID=1869339 RepID=UPI0027308A3C|nr:sensor histidine kinase [Polaromonas sp.]MDP2256121.1 sensor histidine kinase [Polaromonas sp.]